MCAGGKPYCHSEKKYIQPALITLREELEVIESYVGGREKLDTRGGLCKETEINEPGWRTV